MRAALGLSGSARRTSHAFALVSVAAALEIVEGTITQSRLALGGVGTKPWRVPAAEAAMVGAAATETTFRRAAELAVARAQPPRDNAFKVELARGARSFALSCDWQPHPRRTRPRSAPRRLAHGLCRLESSTGP